MEIQDEQAIIRELRTQGLKRRPTWMSDYEVTEIDQSEDLLIHFALYADCDLVTYEETVQHSRWRKVMDNKIVVKKKNDTWELTRNFQKE